jgi:hypothetical protein
MQLVCFVLLKHPKPLDSHRVLDPCKAMPALFICIARNASVSRCMHTQVRTYVPFTHLACQETKAFWYRLLDDMLLPDMPIGFNPIDVPARDEDVGGGPYFGYCNVPRLTSNLPLPDLWGVDPLTCGKDFTPFSETDHRKDQAIFLGRPTGKKIGEQFVYKHAWTVYLLMDMCLNNPCT